MTLDDLKRAIVRIGPHPTEQDDDLRWKHFHYQRSEAWKAAFEWMHWIAERYAEEIGSYCPHTLGIDTERKEGMMLIREKLK